MAEPRRGAGTPPTDQPGPDSPARVVAVDHVTALLRADGPLTRAEVAARSGLSRASVSAAIQQMTRDECVTERPGHAAPSGRGRPPTLLGLTRRAGLAVGIEVGRSHARAVVAHPGREVLADCRIVADETWLPERMHAAVAGLVDEVLAAAGADRCEVLGVGLGLPAPLDAAGRPVSRSIAPSWAGTDPARSFADALGLPVAVDNDANLAALAEALWSRSYVNLVYVKASTGIGAGMVLDGRLFRGSGGTAGELGHVTVDQDGRICRCGGRGCLEVHVGGPALVSALAHNDETLDDAQTVIARAQAGDLACSRALSDAGDVLGIALAGLVNVVNPERIVLGGELGAAGELVLASLRDRLGSQALAHAVRRVTVARSELGERAGPLGGVLLVLTEPARAVQPSGAPSRSAEHLTA